MTVSGFQNFRNFPIRPYACVRAYADKHQVSKTWKPKAALSRRLPR